MSGPGSHWRRLWGGVNTAPTDELIHALEQLRRGPVPRPDFRNELRAQLVALAPTAVAEGIGPVAVPVHHRRTLIDSIGDTVSGAVAGIAPRRVLRGAVAVTAVCALVLGVAVWLSTRALPGDALYGLKRARESVELNLTHGTAKGRKYLSLAHTRAEETSKLVSRANAVGDPVGDGPQAGAVSSHVTHLIDSTMDAADKDLVDGWGILLTQATQQGSDGPIQYMIKWIPGQVDLLSDTADRLPDGAARNRLLASIQRAEAAKKLATTAAPQVRNGTLPSNPMSTGPSANPGGTGPVPGRSGSSGATGPNGQPSSGATGGTQAPGGSTGGSGGGGSGGGGGGTSVGPPVIPPILPPITLPTVIIPGLPTIVLPTISLPAITLGVNLPSLPGAMQG